MKNAAMIRLLTSEIARGQFRSSGRLKQCNRAHAYNTRTSRAKFFLKMGLRFLAPRGTSPGTLIANPN